MQKKKRCQNQHLFHAGDRNRTGTGGKSRRILSPVRLPVPPRRHQWMEKDSNLRSRRQQIYSLPPLAARESIQLFSQRTD